VSLKQEEIIQRIISGNTDGVLDFLYKNLLSKVRSYIAKNNGSKDEANDIFQDAVIVFFEYVRKGKFDTSKSIEGFIYTVARNLWVDKIRRERKVVRLNDIDLNTEPQESFDVLKDILDKEKRSAMSALFNLLGSGCKELMYYQLYEKLSMKEISEKLGFSNENVAKTKNYKCKQRFAEILKANPNLIQIIKN